MGDNKNNSSNVEKSFSISESQYGSVMKSERKSTGENIVYASAFRLPDLCDWRSEGTVLFQHP